VSPFGLCRPKLLTIVDIDGHSPSEPLHAGKTTLKTEDGVVTFTTPIGGDVVFQLGAAADKKSTVAGITAAIAGNAQAVRDLAQNAKAAMRQALDMTTRMDGFAVQATATEAALTGRLATEESRAAAAEAQLDADLAGETARATAAEQATADSVLTLGAKVDTKLAAHAELLDSHSLALEKQQNGADALAETTAKQVSAGSFG